MGKSNLLRRLMIVYIFTFAAAPVSYLIRILYARSFSIEQYGLFYSILALLGLVAIFKNFGLQHALVHYLPKLIKNKQQKEIKSAVSFVAVIDLVTSLAILIFLIYFRDFFADVFFKTSLASSILPLLAVYFVLNSIMEVMKNVFVGYRKEFYYSSFNPIRLLFVLAASFLVFLFVKENFLINFAIIWVLSVLFVILIYLYPLLKICPSIAQQKFRSEPQLYKVLVKYGFFVMAGVAATAILGRIDVAMLTYLRGITDVALYEIALPIASIILVVITPMNRFLFSHTSHFYHTKNFEVIRSMLQAIYNTGLFLFLPLGLVFLLFPKEIIALLFGAKYLAAAFALKILSIGFIFKGFTLLNFAVIGGINKVKSRTIITYIGVACDIFLNLLLIPKWGIDGAAVATMASFAVMYVLSFAVVHSSTKFAPSFKNWLKIGVNCALFVLLVHLLKTSLNLNLYVEATLVILISGTIYLAVGLAWKIIDYKRLKKEFFKTFVLEG